MVDSRGENFNLSESVHGFSICGDFQNLMKKKKNVEKMTKSALLFLKLARAQKPVHMGS